MKAGLLILSFVLLLSVSPAWAVEYKAKVVGISDGDTITVLDDAKTRHKIRLAEIDAPELSQPYGKTSKEALSNMVMGSDVYVYTDKKDRYGRELGDIYIITIHINKQMVMGGHAWAYRKYLTNNAILEAENIARARKLGIWSMQADQIVPPWEWRKTKKSEGKLNEQR